MCCVVLLLEKEKRKEKRKEKKKKREKRKRKKKKEKNKAIRHLRENFKGLTEILLFICSKLKIHVNYKGIQKFCEIYLPILENKCRIAATLTTGLDLRLASEITNTPISSIKWGRQQIKKGVFQMMERYVPAPSTASEQRKNLV